MTLASTPWLLSPCDAERPCVSELAEIATRAKEGDQRALRCLYERFGPRISRFLQDMLRDRNAAADALQETFTRIFVRIESLEDPAKVVSWMFSIARHVSQEHRRAAARAGSPRDDADLDAYPLDCDTPEHLLLGAEASLQVEAVIAGMSADRRAILLLRSDQLLGYEEIADAMGCSVAKVKVELHRARLALRKVLLGDGVDS